MEAEVAERETVLSDEELWVAFCEGDDSAYTLLYYRFSDRLYSYLRLLLGSSTEKHNIDDAFQETWVKIFNSRDKFVAAGSGAFTGWVFRIAHNLAISLVRRPRYVSYFNEYPVNMPAIDKAVSPEYDPMSDERGVEQIMAIVQAVVEELPLNMREIYLMAETERLTLAQIADALAVTKANAKVRLFRARQLVRQKVLLELGIEPSARESAEEEDPSEE